MNVEKTELSFIHSNPKCSMLSNFIIGEVSNYSYFIAMKRQDIFRHELPYPEYLDTEIIKPPTNPNPTQNIDTLYEEKTLASKFPIGNS